MEKGRDEYSFWLFWENWMVMKNENEWTENDEHLFFVQYIQRKWKDMNWKPSKIHEMNSFPVLS